MGTKILDTPDLKKNRELSDLCNTPGTQDLKLKHFDQVTPKTNLIVNRETGKATMGYLASKLSGQKEANPSGVIVLTMPLNDEITEEHLQNLAERTGRKVYYLPKEKRMERAYHTPTGGELYIELKPGTNFQLATPKYYNARESKAPVQFFFNFNIRENSIQENATISETKTAEMEDEMKWLSAEEKHLERFEESVRGNKIKEIAQVLGKPSGIISQEDLESKLKVTYQNARPNRKPGFRPGR